MPVNKPCPLRQHLHKYTFRLMYGICTNNSLATNYTDIIYIYQEAKHCRYRIKTPANTIEGFFLVPEKLSWIIEPYTSKRFKKDGVTPLHNIPLEQDPEKLYKFRLAHIICTDGAAIKSDVQMTSAYQQREQAEPLIKNRTNHWLWEDKTKPVPQDKVESFYLVPEKLWWILAPFAKEFLIKDRVLALVI